MKVRWSNSRMELAKQDFIWDPGLNCSEREKPPNFPQSVHVSDPNWRTNDINSPALCPLSLTSLLPHGWRCKRISQSSAAPLLVRKETRFICTALPFTEGLNCLWCFAFKIPFSKTSGFFCLVWLLGCFWGEVFASFVGFFSDNDKG